MADNATRFTDVEITGGLTLTGGDLNVPAAGLDLGGGGVTVSGGALTLLAGGLTVGGFAVPVCAKLGSFAFGDIETSGTAIKIGTLPAKAMLLAVIADVKTGVNGTDSAIDIGLGAAAGVTTAWLASTDITEATAGVYGKAVYYKAGATAVDVFLEHTFSVAATAGAVDVYAVYFPTA